MTRARIFVDVDVQRDFCNEGGALRVPGSPIGIFRKLVRHAVAKGIPIVGSVDSHAWDAWEFSSSGNRGPSGEAPSFPDHCVKGTEGWLKVAGTLPPRFRFVPNVPQLALDGVVEELASGQTHAVYFEKEVYSLFANPLAERFLRALVLLLGQPASDEGGAAEAQRKTVRASELAASLGAEPPEFCVFGVATDYCVKAAALGLAQRGFACTVLTDAIAGISPAGSEAALAEMKKAGVHLAEASRLFGL